ncbi:MAG: esterase [Prevotella sp.]|nr:esterase [Prevotella sp.]
MENPYVKQYPELLSGKTLMYVHGFGSSGQSGTVTRLRTVFPNTKVVAPDLPVDPFEAMTLLKQLCDDEQPALILGTSMGGMYTEQLYGYDRICMNPAMCIADTMQAHGMTGTQTFQNPRLDGVSQFYVDKALVKAYRTVSEQRFAHVDDEERMRVYGLFGDRDEVVDTFEMFQQHYPNAIHFHGEHRMDDRSFMHSVVPVIRWIDDRQEKRERPIVYIGIECLWDSYKKPTSSSQKTVRQLIENYQVYFVAPSASSCPADYAEVVVWLREYFDVMAWGHTIFTNQRQLLYGDYLIEKTLTRDSMATRLEYGSDTFKTWEAVLDYFSLLGGQ